VATDEGNRPNRLPAGAAYLIVMSYKFPAAKVPEAAGPGLTFILSGPALKHILRLERELDVTQRTNVGAETLIGD